MTDGGLRADLHTHTVCSDGKLTPQRIVELACGAGVRLVAVTDHDAMQACAELGRLAKERGLLSVNGIEISAYTQRIKFHTLGYNVNEKLFEPFQKKLFQSSYERAEEIVFKLNKLGMEITMDDVNRHRYSLTAPVHSMYVVYAAAEKGYVETVPKFYKKYLEYSKPAFTCIRRPSPEEAVEAIKAAGGVAVVAHPARIRMDRGQLEEKIKSLIPLGLDGIEVYYTTHTESEKAYYSKLCDGLHLLKTGGSDTHSEDGGRAIGQPPFYADLRLLEKLKIV
ncbi:MAG: PHP domain-containing protein [Clostridia bacterium]|nr:PHP domain-containing protein [Clostridia bacterium]